MKDKLFTRNFTFLILGQVSSLIGNYTLKFALSMYVLEQTGSASIFATLLAVAMLPTILLSPFGGILADRANRRNIMVGLDTLSGLTVLVAGLVLPFGHDIWVIGALLVILSVLTAFESPTVQACIPQMLSGDNLMKGNAAVNQVQAIAGLVTPFLGSLVYAAFGLTPVLWGTVACFFLTAILECFIRLDHQKAEVTMSVREIIREDFCVSIRFLRHEQPGILKLLLLAALASLFVAGTVVVGFPYLVRTVLGLSAEHYGPAESAMGVAAVLGSLFVGITAQKFRLRWLAFVFIGLGLSLVPTGIAFLLPVGPLGVYIVLLVMFSLGQFGCSLFSTYAISIQARTPEHLMGPFDAFCKKVLRNEARAYLRNMKRRREREAVFSDLSPEELYPSDSTVFSIHGYDLLIDNELVAEAFAKLPQAEQSILILRCTLDLPDGEIGPILGMSRSAVQRHRTRALQELRQKLSMLMPRGG